MELSQASPSDVCQFTISCGATGKYLKNEVTLFLLRFLYPIGESERYELQIDFEDSPAAIHVYSSYRFPQPVHSEIQGRNVPFITQWIYKRNVCVHLLVTNKKSPAW